MTDAPLHLAIDSGPLHGHRTGVGVAAAGMITALGRRDDVDVIPYVVSFRARVGAGERRLPLPGIVASHVWSRGGRPTADRWLRGADVVHGTNYVAPPTRLPTVVSVYDCWFLRHPDLATPLVRRAGRVLRRAVGRGAWVHTSSQATTEEARELLATDRVATVLLGAPDTADLDPPDEPPPTVRDLAGRAFVVAIATEEYRKDLPLLVSAFERLAVAHPDVPLVLAGAAGDDSARLRAAIESADPEVRSRIRRLGPVDGATKSWLLAHAAVLAYPSLDEGFGFPVLEANAVGAPVVATAVGSIPEVAGDAARLVADRDPTSLAAALDDVLTDDALRAGLIAAGRRNVERFDWSTTAAGLTDLYRRAREDVR